MRLRLPLLVAAGVAALALPASAVVPAPDCHGIAFTDASNDQILVSNVVPVRPTQAIDIRRVYLTGSGSTQKVNIEVGQLSAWNNTEYSFSWLDDVNFPYSWELVGTFLGTNGTSDAQTQALLYHRDINGSAVAFSGHATVRAFHGAVVNGVEGPGVIQFELPQDWGPLGFPATITGMKAGAVQYESNAVTTIALREDTAAYNNPSNGNNWTQPC
jgi:hypothetical protein